MRNPDEAQPKNPDSTTITPWDVEEYAKPRCINIMSEKKPDGWLGTEDQFKVLQREWTTYFDAVLAPCKGQLSKNRKKYVSVADALRASQFRIKM